MNMKISHFLILFLIANVLFNSCQYGKKQASNDGRDSSNVTLMKTEFGKIDNQVINLYTLTNANGITVKITNYGAIITAILTPDKNGISGDIVLGFDSLAPYLSGHPYFGCIAGRFANRINKGKFTLGGQTYQLSINNGPNHLHGGINGFDKKVWQAQEVLDSAGAGVVMTLLSPDGDEGYPGNLKVTVTYRLGENDELSCLIEAETDKPTPVNLCNHTYFNLNGAKTSILDHILEIFANNYTEVDQNLIPTGVLPEVQGGPMDFSTPYRIGERIDKVQGGYDHNYVLVKGQSGPEIAARLYDPFSGRMVEVLTTQPGVQFYSGNFLDGTITGKGGTVYYKHWGMCLETQHFPDSPNQKSFPDAILLPGEKFQELTIYRFSVK